MKRPTIRLAVVSALAALTGLAEVRVSNFGFDPEDSTAFIQKALDSGEGRIVLDRRPSPWVTRSLFGRSDQEVVLEPGVVLEAKRGAFRERGDCLLSFEGCRNVRISGNGATVRMWREDYAKRPYEPSEHRHALSFIGCSGVTVEGLVIEGAGGDAIYFGAPADGCCRDVVVSGVVTTNSHRQGVSVISAENLLLRDCRFLDTCGVPPMAGVDFEPNAPGQRLVNCVVSNCYSSGNHGFAWDVVVGNLSGSSRPVSIDFIGCRSVGDGGWTRVFCENRDFDEVRGRVTYSGCDFADQGHTMFSVRQDLSLPIEIDYRDSTCRPRDGRRTRVGDLWRKAIDAPVVKGATGAVTKVVRNADFAAAKLTDSAGGRMVRLADIRGRFGIRYVFHAEKGKPVHFLGRQMSIVRGAAPSESPVTVRTSGNETVTRQPIPGFDEAEIAFDVPETGFYTMDVAPGRHAFVLTASDVPVAIDVTRSEQAVFKSQGEVFVAVPANAPAFSIVTAGSGNEGAGVRICAPDGEEFWNERSVLKVCRFVPEVRPAGLWSVALSPPHPGVLEDFKLDLAGIAGHIFLSREKYWTIPLKGGEAGAEGPLAAVAPADGEMVSLLTAEQRAFLSLSRERRAEFFDDARKDREREIATYGTFPVPAVLEWRGGVPPFRVTVTKRGDQKPFIRAKTSRRTLNAWNLEIAATYDWTVEGRDGTCGGSFRTEDLAPRLLKFKGTYNVRDLGGRVMSDGRRVRQGLVFRSAGLNDNAKVVDGIPVSAGADRLSPKVRQYVLDTFGIRTDLDLRSDGERFGMRQSPLGPSVNFVHVWTNYHGYSMVHREGLEATRRIFRLLMDRKNYPLVFHCIGGADRTGTVATLLHGVLGASDEDIWKDYQVTAWQGGINDARHLKWFVSFVNSFDRYEGRTLSDRIRAFFLANGFTAGDLERIRDILLEDRNRSARSAKDFVPSGRMGADIQRAIDAAHAAGGGRVRLEDGVYRSGTLYLRSGVELHIPEGTKLLGGVRPEDYDDVDDPRIGSSPEGSRKVLVSCIDGTDVAITGGGVIDGQGVGFYDTDVPEGRFFRKPPHPRPRMVQFFRCRNVRFEGVTFKDSPGWTFWLRECENVAVDGIAIDGHQQMINNDGIDIDACRHVRIGHSRFRTGDDCLILRALRRPDGLPAVCEDVVVSNCTLNSRCQGVRIGCPSDDTIRNALFRDIVCDARNGIIAQNPYAYLHPGDAGYLSLSNIVFENWELRTDQFPIWLTVDPGIRLRDFGHLTFRNFKVDSAWPFTLSGSAESPLVDVRFERMSGRVAREVPIEMKSVEDVIFDGFAVTSGRGTPSPLRRQQGSSWETRRSTGGLP